MSPRRSRGGPFSGYANCSTSYRMPSLSRVVQHHGQAVGEPLPFPASLQILSRLGEAELESERGRRSEIAPDACTAIDPELGKRTIPGQADDMAGRRLPGMLIGRTSHIGPPRREVGVRRFGLAMHLVKDSPTLPFLELGLVVLERDRWLAERQVEIERRDPERPGSGRADRRSR